MSFSLCGFFFLEPFVRLLAFAPIAVVISPTLFVDGVAGAITRGPNRLAVRVLFVFMSLIRATFRGRDSG